MCKKYFGTAKLLLSKYNFLYTQQKHKSNIQVVVNELVAPIMLALCLSLGVMVANHAIIYWHTVASYKACKSSIDTGMQDNCYRGWIKFTCVPKTTINNYYIYMGIQKVVKILGLWLGGDTLFSSLLVALVSNRPSSLHYYCHLRREQYQEIPSCDH